MRAKIPIDVEAELLIRSGRRCCLCYGLGSDFEVKAGQIAHIDRDPSNNEIDNLSFLCLAHHDQYDSRTSQSKGFKPFELVEYRRRLHEKVERSLGSDQKLQEAIEQSLLEEAATCDAVDRLWQYKEDPRLTDQISDRFRRLLYAIKEFEASTSELFALPDMTDDQTTEAEKVLLRERKRCLVKYQLPDGIYFVDDGIEDVSEEWIEYMEVVFDRWRCGLLSHKECEEMIEEVDWSHDLDILYILFGVHDSILGRLGMRYLRSVIYQFGTRKREG